MGFGKKLEEKMEEKGLKQADIVRLTGIPKTTLSSMLIRDNTKVDVEIFIKICNVLGCKPEEFSSEIVPNTKRDPYDLSADEKRIVDAYRNFNKNGKEKILDTISDMELLPHYKKERDPISKNIS